MSVKDFKGSRISQQDAKDLINDILHESQGEKFKGAVKEGELPNTFDIPVNVEEAQNIEKSYRNEGNLRTAGEFAQGFLGTIAQKLIYQTILKTPTGEDLAFAERFRGANIDFGVGKEYTATQMSGHQKLDQNAFVPTAATKSTVISQINTFLKQNGQLNDQSKAFMEQFCTSIQVYATKEYMLSDVKLQEFIQQLKDSVIDGAKLYIYNLVMETIKTGITNASTTPDGSKWTLINGTATNMFDACIEICEHVEMLTKLGNEYQLIKSTNPAENHIRAASYNDLIWIWSIKNKQRANRGVKSQLYHYKLWDPANGLSDANVYSPYKKVETKDLTVSKENNYPSMTGDLWIDDNTVVILENNAIEYNLVWEKSETQYYTNNMTLQITYNLAGMINPIKVMRGFVYKNPNLSTVPNGQ